MKCIFTNNEIKSIGNYIRYESKRHNLTTDELRFLLYRKNYGEEICENFKHYYEELLYSIPDFKKQFNVYSGIVYFLAKYHKIKLRTILESSQLIGKIKTKHTLQEKYGVTNPSQLKWVGDKKRKTFLKHYGVDNIWKTKNYLSKLESLYLDKYKMTISDYRSIKTRERWNDKTTDEKQQWLLNSIHSDKSQLKQLRGYNKSKLECKVEKILKSLSITYTHTFLIKISTKKRYFYDFYLKDFNTILEINGDYWHANPIIYKENDLLHYKFKTILAKDIWEKDKLKIIAAETRGYKVKTIWESEIKSDADITKILYETCKNKINKKNSKRFTKI